MRRHIRITYLVRSKRIMVKISVLTYLLDRHSTHARIIAKKHGIIVC